jgi:thiamine pyrophosphokinase
VVNFLKFISLKFPFPPCAFAPLYGIFKEKCPEIFLLGIVFTGGESPPAAVIRKELEGKDAFFVAADSGLIAAEEAGKRPDFIVGDMDSVDAARLKEYSAERVIRYPCDKDFTDTELALQKAVEKGCDKIWIIGGGGGRVDHLFAIRSLFERDIFPERWLAKDADIRCIDARTAENTLSCRVEKNASVSVFPLGNGPWDAKSEGLKWQLDGLSWNRGFFGLSNVAANGSFFIKAQNGRFMAILPPLSD